MNALIQSIARRCFRTACSAAACAGISFFIMPAPVRSAPSGVEFDIVSDTSWVCSPTETTGWQDVAFDDSAWTAAVEIAGYPYPPGNFIPGTSAIHIWEAGTTGTSPAYFRRTFWLPLPAMDSRAVVRVDDGFQFYVNGTLVGGEAGPHAPRTYDITPHLRQGANAFALRCVNTIGSFRSVVFDADVVILPVSPQASLGVVSDTTWSAGPTAPAGWEAPEFDDSAWAAAAHISGYPYPPAGYIPGTTAKHVWTNPTSSDVAFLRKTVMVPGFPDVTSATVRVDDAYDFYVNGMLAGAKHTVHPAGAQSYDITPYLRHGTNVFAIKGWDLGGQQAALFDVDIAYYPNLAPVADAGGARTAEPGADVHLNGGASLDDYTLLSDLGFAWTIESSPPGSVAALAGDDTPHPTLVPDVAGDYLVKLVVTDEQGLTGEDLATVSAAPLVENGGFESGFDGWTATGNVTIQSGPPYSASEGAMLVSFNDRNRQPDGVLTRAVPTMPGIVYRLELDIGVLAYNTKQQRLGIEVSNGAVILSDTVVLTGRSGGRIDWVSKSYLFTAESDPTTVILRDLSTWTNAIDLLVDNLRVSGTALPLLVASDPQAGVGIDVTPADPIGGGNGTSVFQRIYNPGTVVELTAPETAGDRAFFHWVKNGVPETTDRMVEVIMDDAHQLTAVYRGGEPVITGQPVDAAALDGGTAEFRVTASGGVPLVYQWRFEGTDIPGAENPVLVIDPVRPEHSGGYDVVVRNRYGGVVSDSAGLTIGSSFAGLENGSFEEDFQGWTVSGNIGVKSAPPYAATDGAKLAVFNAANTRPDGVLFQKFDTTPGQPYVLGFDMGVLAYNKLAQSLDVEVTGSPSLVADVFTMHGAGSGRIVWQARTLPFVADSPETTVTFRDVSPATNAIDLLVDHVVVIPVIMRSLAVESTPVAGVMIDAEAWNSGAVSSGFTPFDLTFADGADVTLAAPDSWMTSSYPVKGLEYRFVRWLRDGDVSDSAVETVVTMDADHVMTAEYELAAPYFKMQPADMAAGLGDSVNFTVDMAGGDLSYAYQWRFEGTEIPGANDSSHAIASVTAADVGTYDVVVTSNGVMVTSDSAELALITASLVNGGFESGFDGWSASGNVRVQDTTSAPEGTKAAAFNSGNSVPDGVVSQTFATVPGAGYVVTYKVGVLAYNTSLQTLGVEVANGGILASASHSIRGIGKGKTVWRTHSLVFTADDGASTVTFRDLSPATNAIDLLVDDVILEMVP